MNTAATHFLGLAALVVSCAVALSGCDRTAPGAVESASKPASAAPMPGATPFTVEAPKAPDAAELQKAIDEQLRKQAASAPAAASDAAAPASAAASAK